MAEPRLLVLDEPTLGLAPIVVEEMFRVVRDINGSGVTVLLVEQNTQHALSLANRGYVLEAGRVVMSGTGSELLTNKEGAQGLSWPLMSWRNRPSQKRSLRRAHFHRIRPEAFRHPPWAIICARTVRSVV